jgi:hypothetical protein
MPEYFEISLITRKTDSSKATVSKCLLENFGLAEGKNKAGAFGNRNVIVEFYEGDTGRDFNKIFVCFSEQVFHKDNFEKELSIFTSFITTCFECCPEVEFALCSYEINAYLLRNTKKLKDFNDELLNKFPISYRRQIGQKHPLLGLNLEAQDIF